MISRVQRIIDRIGELRQRFHLDAAPWNVAQSRQSFADTLAQESQRVAQAGNVLKPFQTPAATQGMEAAKLMPPMPITLGPLTAPSLNKPAQKPQGFSFTPLQVPTLPTTAQSSGKSPLSPPPLPALPFDAQLEPYLQSMTPRVPGTPSLGGQTAIPPSLYTAPTDSLLIPGGQNGALNSNNAQSILDLYRKMGTWNQALSAYGASPGAGLTPGTSGLPFP